MTLLLVAILIPLGIWFYLFREFMPGTGVPVNILRVALALGFSLGTGSCLFFVWIACGGGTIRSYWLMEITCLASLLGVVILWRKRHQQPSSEILPLNQVPTEKSLKIVFCIACISAATFFLFQTLRCPYGYDDSFTIWNLHARILYFSPDGWQVRLTDTYASHPDYPLLLPATIARVWTACGDSLSAVPAIVAFLFGGSVLALTYALVAVMRGSNQGLLAGLTLLGTSFFVKHSASQYADVPLALFITASLGLICLYYDRMRQTPGLLVLAGTAAALAAWTKNEGMLFFVCLSIALGSLSVIRGGWKTALYDTCRLMAGMVAVLLVLYWFKLNVESTNDLIRAQTGDSIVGNFKDFSRYMLIARAYVVEFCSLLGGLAIVLPGLWWLWGKSPNPAGGIGRQITAGTLILMLLGFFAVYLTTYLEIDFHLGTSLRRLFLQLWPAAIVLYFLWLASPEEVRKEAQENA